MRFNLYLPTKYYFGYGSLSLLPEKAKTLGKKPLLLTGKKHLREKGLLDKILNELKKNNLKAILFNEISPNPKVEEMNRGGEIAKEENCDFIIGIGGGSVMDSAKGCAIIAKNPKSIWDYTMGQREPENSPLPILLVPTTPSTGSELNSTCIVTNLKEKRKWGVFTEKSFPALSIVDPSLTETLKFSQIALSSIDIITHILEPYLTANPDSTGTYVQDSFAVILIKGAIESTLKLKKNMNDKSARENLSLISGLALSGIPNKGKGGYHIMHWLEHILSGLYDEISHPEGLATLLIPFIRKTKRKNLERVEHFERKMEIESIEEFFSDYLNKIESVFKLKDLAVKREDIDKMVQEFTFLKNKFPKFNLGEWEEEEVREIYAESY